MSVDVNAIAKALNITPRRVQQLKLEGLPSQGRGKYELGPCMFWYIRFLQTALEKRGPNTNLDTPDLLVQRTRLAKEQGDKIELENSIKRSELIYGEEAAEIWSEHIQRARSKILYIPSKLAPQLVNIENANVIAERIRDELDAALSELAEIDNEQISVFKASNENMESSTEIDDFGMGGQVS